MPDVAATRTVMVGNTHDECLPVALRSVVVGNTMIEKAARKLATECGAEDVFRAADDGEMVEDVRSADYWRMLASKALWAALRP